MLKRTVFPAALIVLLGITLWAFKRNDKSPETKEQMLLTAIGTILEQKHYSPKPIDDNFSKQVFTKYLQALNPDKNIFLQSDIDYLKKYLQTEQVERFIVGEPKQMDNTPSQSAVHVKGFVNLLKKQFPDIPISMLDERFTSKMASAAIAQSGMSKKARQSKELVDTVSATILLQSWMEGLKP